MIGVPLLIYDLVEQGATVQGLSTDSGEDGPGDVSRCGWSDPVPRG